MRARFTPPAGYALVVLLTLGPALAAGRPDPQTVLDAAKAEAVTIPKQAEALTRLAWPTEPNADPEVQAAARDQLVKFGSHGMEALRGAIQKVAPAHRADVTATLIQAMRQVTAGIPPDYLPGLDEALWHGSVEARRLAIPELARFRQPGGITMAIDAATLHPELRKVTVRALGLWRDARARFFLGDILDEGTSDERVLAATALARIGGDALGVLREATRSEIREVREIAARTLAPLAGLDDLTVLHEYAGMHGDDDPAVIEIVVERAAFLEALLEQATGEGAAPPRDF